MYISDTWQMGSYKIESQRNNDNVTNEVLNMRTEWG